MWTDSHKISRLWAWLVAPTLAYEFKVKASIASVSCTIEEDVHTYLAD